MLLLSSGREPKAPSLLLKPVMPYKCVIEEAKKAKEEGKEKVILLNWSGHGLMDLGGYDSYFSGKLVDYPLPEEEMKKSLKSIEGLPKPKMLKKG